MVDWKKAILEARRVLKSNGYLVAGDSGVGELQCVAGQKYTELLDEYVNRRKNLRYFFWKYFLKKISKIEFFGHILDMVKKRENWETFLKTNARYFETKVIKWEEEYDNSEVLKRLEDCPFSFQWSIPVETHKEVMRRLRNFIMMRRGNHFVEKIERKFKVCIAKSQVC